MRSPIPLLLLAAITFFERAASNGFRAVLVLHLAALWANDQRAIEVAAWVAALVYVVPLGVGVWATTPRRARWICTAGAVALTTGYFSLAALPGPYLGIGLVVLGRGAMLPTIRAMVGGLYRDEPTPVSERAFSRVYIAANFGTLLGILVTGGLQNWQGATIAFISCGTFALAAVCFLAAFGWRYPAGELSESERPAPPAVPVLPVARPWVQPAVRVRTILIITAAAALFWSGFEQRTGSLTIFASAHVRAVYFGVTIPPQWFQALNPLMVVLFAAPVAWAFRRFDWPPERGGAVSPITKLAWGLILLGTGYLFLVAVEMSYGDGRVGPWVLVGLYAFHTVGELCLEPIGQSLTARLSPAKWQVFWQAVWDFASFAAPLIAGYLPRFLVRDDAAGGDPLFPLWVVLAGLGVSSGLVLWAWSGALTARVAPLIEDPPPAPPVAEVSTNHAGTPSPITTHRTPV